ncbi:glucose/quinate/shikimate family membrane-bound PQQ-dependent dehydrogenase [Enhydrobacter aerosaccus]|nr:glucose/quinate/shikimate family membrane-bound PQQ-dependent dehydrogenase [Enhydrobacter aerosaccus]
MASSSRSAPVLVISALIVGLLGLALLAGGLWLTVLGGSWYYWLAGLGFVVTAVFLYRRRAAALWLYALIVLGTLGWSVAEIGLDWWPLAARGGIVFLIGLWLLMPWITRALAQAAPRPVGAWRGAGIAVTASLAIAAVVGVIAMMSQTDPMAATGRLPTDKVAEVPADYAGVKAADWSAYGRSSYGDRYSPLADITPQNVAQLKVAWTYHTGDIRSSRDPLETTYELTPLKVDGKVFICTPHDIAMALDPDTGRELWRFDPKIKEASNLQHLTCRGVSYHEAQGAEANGSGECSRRIFLPTADARLFALDAETGKPCIGFGDGGAVNLWQGMPDPAQHVGQYYSTSPPVVAHGLVIIAGEVTDNYSTDEPSGVVRAYDVTSGRLVWNFDSGNPDQTAPLASDQHYVKNSPNSWTVSSADEALGLIYVPYGNQTPDQWGGDRGANAERFASSITALEIDTGKVRWVYQTVHHDLWDMDVGAQPSLIDLHTASGVVPALVAPTKTGNFFVLDRRYGQPLFPAPEKDVPQGAAPGDHTAAMQPFSTVGLMPHDRVRERDMWGATMFDQLACRIAFRSLRYDGPFTPPSPQGSLVFPGNFGVIDWGGVAVDPVRQIVFANPSYMAFVDKLDPPERAKPRTPPAQGMERSSETGGNPDFGAPYSADLHPFLSPIGLPCQAPPWGYVAGLDLRTGKVAYRHKNGTIRDESPIPLPIEMGVPSLGGPIVTAGGVAFLTSTLDYYVRAYDVTDGRQLWQDRLPAGAQATPISYRSDKTGRQYLVVVAGGHGSLGTKAGDSIIAYALPQ